MRLCVHVCAFLENPNNVKFDSKLFKDIINLNSLNSEIHEPPIRPHWTCKSRSMSSHTWSKLKYLVYKVFPLYVIILCYTLFFLLNRNYT